MFFSKLSRLNKSVHLPSILAASVGGAMSSAKMKKKALDVREWPFIEEMLLCFGLGPSEFCVQHIQFESCIFEESNVFTIHRGVRMPSYPTYLHSKFSLKYP